MVSLLERMQAWLKLMESRNDIAFRDRVSVSPPEQPVFAGYPDDARAFAEKCASFQFSFRIKDGDVVGALYLDLQGYHEGSHLELEGKVVDVDDMYIVDVDGDGTGASAWYVLQKDKKPVIVYSVEDVVTFPSLTQYLTTGAKRGFAAGAWQHDDWLERCGDPLGAMSMSRDTPPETIERALIAQGATAQVAADLIEWLGRDAAVLVPNIDAPAPTGEK